MKTEYLVTSWLVIAFVLATAIINRVSDIPVNLSKIVPKDLWVPISIYFVIYSVVLSVYSYYWGKHTGEREKSSNKIKRVTGK